MEKLKKHYFVSFKYDDPYPKNFEVRSVQANNVGRAIDLAYKTFKKTRPRKREPKVLIVTAIKI